MLKTIQLTVAMLMLSNIALAEETAMTKKHLGPVLFDTGKSNIRLSEMERLKSIAATIKAEDLLIVVVGRADKRGSSDYNFKLGELRANSIVNALIQLGVDKKRLVVSVSAGKQQSIAPDDNTLEHLQANRRADITSIKPLNKNNTKNNRVQLFGGYGPLGLDDATVSGGRTTVDQKYSGVAGLGYSRVIGKGISVGGTVFTNNSYFLNLGLDF